MEVGEMMYDDDTWSESHTPNLWKQDVELTSWICARRLENCLSELKANQQHGEQVAYHFVVSPFILLCCNLFCGVASTSTRKWNRKNYM